jgi:DNA-directed RNA polymerase specialized sigma subunit
MPNINSNSILKNPVMRNKIAAMFKLEFSDDQIAEKLFVSKNKVISTRTDMGLRRTRSTNSPHLRPGGPGKKPGSPTRKKRPSNSNAKINQFAVLRAFLDQDVKNMSEVANRFGCSRAYVSRVLIQARGTVDQPGILTERNQLYIADNDALLESILGGK